MRKSSLLLGAFTLLLIPPSVLIVHAQQQRPQISLGPAYKAGSEVVTDIQHVPGDTTRLFVVLRNGRIRILRGFRGSNGKYDATPFLDIGGKVKNSGERGLLGLAFRFSPLARSLSPPLCGGALNPCRPVADRSRSAGACVLRYKSRHDIGTLSRTLVCPPNTLQVGGEGVRLPPPHVPCSSRGSAS